jgi:hypothetical protein
MQVLNASYFACLTNGLCRPETVRGYFPDTLAAYLDTSLKDVARSAFAGDAEALVSNGRFLQEKFSEKLVFHP